MPSADHRRSVARRAPVPALHPPRSPPRPQAAGPPRGARAAPTSATSGQPPQGAQGESGGTERRDGACVQSPTRGGGAARRAQAWRNTWRVDDRVDLRNSFTRLHAWRLRHVKNLNSRTQPSAPQVTTPSSTTARPDAGSACAPGGIPPPLPTLPPSCDSRRPLLLGLELRRSIGARVSAAGCQCKHVLARPATCAASRCSRQGSHRPEVCALDALQQLTVGAAPNAQRTVGACSCQQRTGAARDWPSRSDGAGDGSHGAHTAPRPFHAPQQAWACLAAGRGSSAGQKGGRTAAWCSGDR